MRRVVSSWRRRATLFAVAGAALVAAAIAGAILLTSGPATAHWQTLSGKATCDCVVKNAKTNEYRAVFGYDSDSKSAGKIALGDNNAVYPAKLDGAQTTTFQPGSHRASFATGWVSKDTQVSWNVGGQKVSADWNKPTCGRDVSLPATGNGSGPLIALAVSLLIAGGAIVLRKRRFKLKAQ